MSDSEKPKKKYARRAFPLKWDVFAFRYIANNGNAMDAARAAGVRGDDNTLRVAGHRMANNPVIQEKIRIYARHRLKGVKATSDEVLYLLADHLRGDIAVLNDCIVDGVLDLEKAKEMGVSHLIKKLKIRTTFSQSGERVVTTEIEMHDSQSAAAKLGEYLGLKQAPRVNQDDVARVNAEIARLVANGMEPQDARDLVIEAEPSARQWLM